MLAPRRLLGCNSRPAVAQKQLVPAWSGAAAARAPTQPPSRHCSHSRAFGAPVGIPLGRACIQCAASKGQSPGGGIDIENYELVVGDGVSLVCFALWKQIAAIVLSPSFPGWLAPLRLEPLRFLEFASFAGTLLAAWVVAAALTGGYRSAATASVPAALSAACRAWLVAMPVAAAQLVLLTAAESQALVTDEAFASALPLAASGPGEPLATAAGLLGVMAGWRAVYAVFFDAWWPRDVAVEAQRFWEAVASVALLAGGCSALLQLLQVTHELAAGGGVTLG